MLILKPDDTGRKSTTVENGVAHCLHQTVHPNLPKGSRYQCDWFINFDDMTEDDIRVMAAEHIIIKIRRDFAKVDNPEKSKDFADGATFNAKDYVTKRVDKTAKIAKQIESMTDAEKAALLELING